jgi:hypothetical protein
MGAGVCDAVAGPAVEQGDASYLQVKYIPFTTRKHRFSVSHKCTLKGIKWTLTVI